MTDLLVLRIGAGRKYKSESHAVVLLSMNVEEEAAGEHKGKELLIQQEAPFKRRGRMRMVRGVAWPMSRTGQQNKSTTPSFRSLGGTKHA